MASGANTINKKNQLYKTDSQNLRRDPIELLPLRDAERCFNAGEATIRCASMDGELNIAGLFGTL
jgi:hypothetical protein